MAIYEDDITLAHTQLFTPLDGFEYDDNISLSHFQTSNLVPLVNVYRTLTDSILGSEDIPLSLLLNLLDTIAVSDSILGPRVTTDTLTDSLALSDSVLVAYLYQILDTISMSDSDVGIIARIDIIQDKLVILDTSSSLSSFLSTISDIIDLLDSITHGIDKTILDTIAVTEVLVNLTNIVNTILSTILMSDTDTMSSSVLLLTSDTISMSDSDDTTAVLNSLLEEDLVIIIGDLDGGEKYISYLLSPETFSVSTYSNYNFYNSTRFKDDYLFINKTGLYKYGGDTDVLENIEAKIKTAAMSFGTSNLKQLPNFYMGLSNSNKLVLKVSVDGKATVFYKLNKQTENLQTQKIAIGKGLIGRYFQFEVITQENTQFELDALEFYPLVLKRKL